MTIHTIIKYNISIEESKKIFNAYCSNYNVDNDYRYVPIVFVGDKYLVGKQMILDHLEYELLNQDEVKTMLLSSEDGSFEEDIKIINSTKWISVFVAGLVNGLNPCSLAMFIFLISICFVNKEKVKKVALVFLAGKFLTFLLLGTIFYKLLSYVDFSFISTITKAIGILIILVLVVFNLLDFIEVKNNRYNNVKLQLPLGVRKFNHNIMKKINGVMEKKYLLFAVFVISVIVSLGEFMCTGQIYLMTIITVIQYINQFDIRAFLFLIIYNFALIMPIFVIVIFINKGRSVFQMSEHIRQNMPKIKIINSIILIAIAIFMIIS